MEPGTIRPQQESSAARLLSFLAPRRDERRFLLAIGLCGASALWLALAWLEPLALAALPLLGLVYAAGIRAHRGRPRGAGDELDGDAAWAMPSAFWRRDR